MLSFKIIGCGAAGNKAAANLLEKGFPADYVYFVNSTTVDIPKNVAEDKVIIFGKSGATKGGCGKERSIGKKMLIDDMQNDCSVFDKIIDGSEDAIVLCGSTEGGSGSASMPILAKYFKEVHKKPVIVIPFFGFKDDIRGLRNTIEICQEMSEDYTLMGIDNSTFLDTCNGNRFRAEKSANEKLAIVVKILMGGTILQGQQMIDDTDLFKIITTPGYMIADYTQLPDRVKTTEDFNKLISDMLHHSNFIDPPKQAGCKRIGTIFNLIEVDDSIDYSGKVIGEMYGEPYEYFISLAENSTHKNDFYFIASGMKFPIDKIKAVYDEYQNRSTSMDTSKDSFFANIGAMRGNNDDSQFDMFGPSEKKPNLQTEKSDFFASFGVKEFVADDGKKRQTGAVDKSTIEEY